MSMRDQFQDVVAHYLPLWTVLALLGLQWVTDDLNARVSPDRPKLIDTVTDTPIGDTLTYTNPQTQQADAIGVSIPTFSDKWPEDLMFAIVGFWLWAITTNMCSGMLVRGGGSIAGTVDQRERESGVILLFSAVALISTIATANRGGSSLTEGLAVFNLVLPVVVL